MSAAVYVLKGSGTACVMVPVNRPCEILQRYACLSAFIQNRSRSAVRLTAIFSTSVPHRYLKLGIGPSLIILRIFYVFVRLFEFLVQDHGRNRAVTVKKTLAHRAAT